MGRTRRTAIDDGNFSSGGNGWYLSSRNGAVGFPPEGYVQFSLPFSLDLGGNRGNPAGGNVVDVVTLWNTGILSLGPPTQEQIDFFATGASAIADDQGNPGFPGFFFLFDYDANNARGGYDFGLGITDYNAPFDTADAVSAAFFSFSDSYQIILDQYGFAILPEFGFGGTVNGYFIGGQRSQDFDLTVDVDNYPDFLTYAGSGGDDDISGSAYHEVFLSSSGADTIDGLGGFDLVTYESSPSGVSVDLAARTASGGFAAGDVLANIEDLTGSNFGDTLTGNFQANRLLGLAGNDTIFGGAGNDFIEGGAGADALTGGVGIDTVSYRGSPGAVVVSLTTRTASGGDAQGDTISGFENITGSQFDDVLTAVAGGSVLDGGFGDDILVGKGGVDQLIGSFGDDFLVGSGGGDAMDGGPGFDTVSYRDSSARVVISLLAGSASGGDAAGDQLSSVEAIIGSGFDDRITGDSADNRFEGGAGDDYLVGGLGRDTLLGGSGADRLFGNEGGDSLIGGDGDDVLSGGAGNDSLTGDAGNDSLDGGTGADSLDGGLGDDTYFVDNRFDLVTESANGGIDLVRTTVDDYVLGDNLENLQLQLGALKGTGNALGNEITAGSGPAQLFGLAGEDTIFGSGAADTLDGGADNDRLFGRNGNDTIYGGGGDDVINGQIGSDVLYGGEGNDTIQGESGQDQQFGEAGNDVLRGGDLSDMLDGGTGNDNLFGDAGNDTLIGGAGIDRLTGGGGRDVMTGGADKDYFTFDDGDFAGLGATDSDRITDFSHAQGDIIRLDFVDADANAAGDQAFSFIGTAAFGGIAGQLRYEKFGSYTMVTGDLDGNGAADFAIRVDGAHDFVVGDFQL